jgi:L-asparaginase II
MSHAIEVNVLRGTQIESRHQVSAVVINSAGQIIRQYGHATQKIFPRSSIKCLQAIPIFTSQANLKFNITDIELALAGASHSGELNHVNAVKSWLDKIGLSVQDLECGTHPPSNPSAYLKAAKEGIDFDALYNNCSGKHTGMLSSCLAFGFLTHGYTQPDHPLQLEIKKIIEIFCSSKISANETAIDGCSLPTYYLPLQSLALGMARFADCTKFKPEYAEATKSLTNAFIKQPFYLGGTDRYCTDMTKLLEGKGFVKTGAEGVMFASLPAINAGIAVKAHDGQIRAAEIAVSYLLSEIEMITRKKSEIFLNPIITNWNKIKTGQIEVSVK